MKGYRMPDWHHNATEAVVGWSLKGIRSGRPITWQERTVLNVWSRFMAITLKAGVWGRL